MRVCTLNNAFSTQNVINLLCLTMHFNIKFPNNESYVKKIQHVMKNLRSKTLIEMHYMFEARIYKIIDNSKVHVKNILFFRNTNK